MRRIHTAFLIQTAALLLLTGPLAAQQTQPSMIGWRQNGTGRFLDATAPTTWGRIPKGVVRDLWSSSAKPKDASAATQPCTSPAEVVGERPSFRGGLLPVTPETMGDHPVVDGFIQDWLVAGPFPVADAEKDFEAQQIAGEADVSPSHGDKSGESKWQACFLHKTATGDVNMPWVNQFDWLDLGQVLGTKEGNQVGYAMSYLYSLRAGKALVAIEHDGALKAWINGKNVYSSAKSNVSQSYWNTMSYGDVALVREQAVPRFEIELKKGWNRFMLKLVRGSKSAGWSAFLRVIEPDGVEYEETNIVWKVKLPDRSNANPIIVGDNVFVTSEPDDLICIDKKTGKIPWKHSNNYFDATPEADRKANPAFKEKIEPLVDQLNKTDDYDQRLALRRQIRDALVAVDKAKYEINLEDHKVFHFRINGWSTPTPVSDGKYVYVWFTQGVAACYDLAGNRQWIVRVDEIFKKPGEKEGPYSYPSTPVLADGKLIIWMNGNMMVGLDAKTGHVAWKTTGAIGADNGIPALKAMTIAGRNVVLVGAMMIDAADGKPIQHLASGASAVLSGSMTVQEGVVYYAWNQQPAEDYTAAKDLPYKPKMTNVSWNEKWRPRFFFASPLMVGDLLYSIENVGRLTVGDLKTGAKCYEQLLDMRPWVSANSVGVSASPAAAGKYVYFFDNQGTSIVLEQGRQFKQVARNRIETQMYRPLPHNPQEMFNASPVFDGKFMYLRGEQYLYCIGEK